MNRPNTSEFMSFNTQPPEGGWLLLVGILVGQILFQHTAARRRLVCVWARIGHPKAFQHTAARRRLGDNNRYAYPFDSFNTQPPEGGWIDDESLSKLQKLFQHTAARRRLVASLFYKLGKLAVSTHSRPKAAGCVRYRASNTTRFQHTAARRRLDARGVRERAAARFQHTAARRRLGALTKGY